MRRSRLGMLFAILIAFALVAAACGDDDDGARRALPQKSAIQKRLLLNPRRSQAMTRTWSTWANLMTVKVRSLRQMKSKR